MTLNYSSGAALFRTVALCCSLSLSFAAYPSVVVTVSTKSNNAIEQALSGIRSKLPLLVPDTTVVTLDALDDQQPTLLVTLGSKAIQKAHERFPSVAVLSCLILDGEILKNYPNNSGIVMQHSIDQQLLWHSRMLPKAKRIGILYSPNNNEEHVALIEKNAQIIGLEVVKVPVNSEQDLPSALRAIKRNADSILAIPDPIVYSGKTAKGVLLFSFRNKIPLAGLSKAWVKAGALYALDWDYLQLGEQCASEAAKKLSGQETNKLKTPTSDMSSYIINQRTATSMKLTIDPSLIEGASYVFK